MVNFEKLDVLKMDEKQDILKYAHDRLEYMSINPYQLGFIHDRRECLAVINYLEGGHNETYFGD